MNTEQTVEEVMENFHGTDIYETYGFVKRTRKYKICNLCGNDISTGSSHIYYKFYGEDGDFPTFNICNDCETNRADDLNRIRSGEFDEN